MTKRARPSTQAVLDAIALSNDEDFEVDDPAEPFMEGSDEEFSDLLALLRLALSLQLLPPLRLHLLPLSLTLLQRHRRRFSTCSSLLADLERDGIYSCGTARKDRKGFPEALKKPKLSKRSCHFVQGRVRDGPAQQGVSVGLAGQEDCGCDVHQHTA